MVEAVPFQGRQRRRGRRRSGRDLLLDRRQRRPATTAAGLGSAGWLDTIPQGGEFGQAVKPPLRTAKLGIAFWDYLARTNETREKYG
jgi:hypothetical protein